MHLGRNLVGRLGDKREESTRSSGRTPYHRHKAKRGARIRRGAGHLGTKELAAATLGSTLYQMSGKILLQGLLGVRFLS